MQTPASRPALTFPIWFGYVFFVVYGSLVPLDFTPQSIEQAWHVFQHIQMFKLGIESRADWIANGVLYVPVGFLTLHLLTQKFPGAGNARLSAIAIFFSVVLAVGVEFTQIFFPPRTVSLNDILSESIGSLIGILLAAKYSDWFRILLHALTSNPRTFGARLLEAYLVAYVAFSLFPYDVLLSAAEIRQKLQGDSWGWLLAGDSPEKILVALKLVAEIVLTIPFGLFIGYRAAKRPVSLVGACLLGFLLGGFIEIAQFFTASGVSQGASVLTRLAGTGAGFAILKHRARWDPEEIGEFLRRIALPLAIVYALALLEVNGWFSHQWDGPDFAISRIGSLHFLPFYYHYYTTEAKALFSLASVCLMYLPIGVLCWSGRKTPAEAFSYALFFAALVETGKLFLHGMHPDPTNVVIGGFAAWVGVRLINEFAKAAPVPSLAQTAAPIAARDAPWRRTDAREIPADGYFRAPGKIALLIASAAFSAYWAATFPTQPVLLVLFLAACASILWHRPAMFLVIVPACLPIFDLAPWSGRYFLDEFDLLLAVGITIGYARIPSPTEKRGNDLLLTLTCGLVALAFAIGALRGLYPWQSPDANSFTSYYSPFNALRIGKGVVWGLLSFGLLRRLLAARVDVGRLLALGMTCGLAFTVASVCWERATYASLFDFISDYRVTGPFSSMHVGGAYIECFLAIATPFLVRLILQTRSWPSRLLGVALLLAATYCLMVTYSRNGYFAFAASLAITLFFFLFRVRRTLHFAILALVLGGAALAVALPILTGQFAQSRIASVGKDLAGRRAHWDDALNMRTPGWPTTMFGMGLGRYPEDHYLLSMEGSHAGTYQLKTENGKTFLRFGPGDPIYVEQVVAITPHRNYTLKLELRSNRPDGAIAISLCEKSMLTSITCLPQSIRAGNTPDTWTTREVSFNSGSLGDSPWYADRTVKLGLHSPVDKALIDVDNVRLEPAGGENLLLNGDFSERLDHWFFSADNHLQWHAKSLPVSVLFDMGWLGVIAVSAFSLLAVKRAVGSSWRGDPGAITALAAFAGFLIVGLFDTLIDAPRFLFLFLLLGGICAAGRTSTDPTFNPLGANRPCR